MKRHTIDKFGHALSNSLKLDNDATHIDMGNKRLRFVADPVDEHESVNKAYLDKHYIPIEQRVKQLETRLLHLTATPSTTQFTASDFLSLSADKKTWDAKGLRITNIATAEQLEDASRFSQTCTYDEKTKKFKVGIKDFDLVISTTKEPVVVASRYTTFAPLEFTAYKHPTKALIPTYSARWKDDVKKMFDSRNNEIVWDNVSKQFAYRKDMTNWQ